MSERIRIGFVGAGGIVKSRHLPGLKKIEGVEFVSVVNRSHDSGVKVAKEWEIAEVSDRWESVVKRKDLDVIWIGTAPYLHAAITIAALEAGKHVFCQARMAMNLEEARAMAAVARKHPNQVTMLCPPPHGMKHGPYFQHLLGGGEIGAIQNVRFKALSSIFADPQAPVHWRQQVEQSGQNILTVGIYAEVFGHWLGHPKRLCAQTRVVYPTRGGYTVRVPDVVQALVEWPEGFQGTLEWSGVARPSSQERLEVYGNRGTLVYNFATDEIWLGKFDAKELQRVEIPPSAAVSWNVEETFIKAIRTGEHPEPSFETGVKYMAFLDAIHRSSESGRFVEVPEQ